MRGKKQALLDKYGFVLYNYKVSPYTLIEDERLYELVEAFNPQERFLLFDVLAFNSNSVYAHVVCNFDKDLFIEGEFRDPPRGLVLINNFDTTYIKTQAEYGDVPSITYVQVVMFLEDAGEEYKSYVFRYTTPTWGDIYVYDYESGFYVLESLKDFLETVRSESRFKSL